jgi:hypothetical protein
MRSHSWEYHYRNWHHRSRNKLCVYSNLRGVLSDVFDPRVFLGDYLCFREIILWAGWRECRPVLISASRHGDDVDVGGIRCRHGDRPSTSSIHAENAGSTGLRGVVPLAGVGAGTRLALSPRCRRRVIHGCLDARPDERRTTLRTTNRKDQFFVWKLTSNSESVGVPPWA